MLEFLLGLLHELGAVDAPGYAALAYLALVRRELRAIRRFVGMKEPPTTPPAAVDGHADTVPVQRIEPERSHAMAVPR